LPNFYVLSALSSQLLVFSKLYIMNILVHFLLLLCQSCRSLRKVSFGGLILGLIKSAYHGWLSIMTSSEGPLFNLASSPPILNPSLNVTFLPLRPYCEKMCSCFSKDVGNLTTYDYVLWCSQIVCTRHYSLNTIIAFYCCDWVPVHCSVFW